MSKKDVSRRAQFVNTFGTLGYISLVVQWAWSLLLLFYPQIETGDSFLLPDHTTSTPVHSFSLAPTPLITGIAILITLLVIIASIIMIIRLPKAIGQRGQKITQTAASAMVPIVTNHAPLPEKKKRELSYRIATILKCLFLMIPLVLVLFASETVPLDGALILVIAGFTAACSALWFALQYGLSLLLHVPTRLLW